ncbi:MAG: Cellulose synthase (UDP-forming) (EC [uncultured Sulfurovum sp.]|uniref:Cellulose synthase (UDP-forming) (EC) n=1 Tax=uncultured Sulfurovum sp. TaxID=269237 RepID=A0A6S6TKE4_9BACT|nr:MAG: Cellulose synthase (UDP-forming) (EC [uncultured Sulfurovum sp.]
MNELYFLEPKYDERVPETPQEPSELNQLLFQFFGVVAIMLGLWYLHYRWTASLNMDALWFAIPLAFAESMMFIGTILVVVNFWKVNDTKKQLAPKTMDDVVEEDQISIYRDKKIKIDVYIPVFNEDPALVRETIWAAKKVKKLDTWDVCYYLLDDSGNDEMTKMAKEEGVPQVLRTSSKGRKAGAITNAMDESLGDFIVIIDSDTRLFPNILLNTMGYFKDDAVAWVQTPQWFCDLSEGKNLEESWQDKYGTVAKKGANFFQKFFGKVKVGEDVFANDPAMFFDVIQRRRNNYNASFCCGATSIHRTSALRRVAISRWVDRVLEAKDRDEAIKELDVEYISYHTSEDIYTSLLVHAHKQKKYKSVMHPNVESKMLSPLDLITWSAQRFRYAGGTIDLVTKEFGRFFKSGLSLGQKMMYFSTFWSYTGAIWLTILLFSPIIFMFTNIAPVQSYSMDFFIHLIPFLFFNQMALLIATWGINSNRGGQFFIAIFPIILRAFWDVARRKPIRFVVTSKTAKAGNYLSMVRVQMGLIGLYAIAIIYATTMHVIGERIYLTGYSVNLMWSFFNMISLWAIVQAALYKFEE